MIIDIYRKSDGKMEAVQCWKTATPHFVITKPLRPEDPNLDVSGYFNVTHAKSTAIALGPFTDIRLAELCAAIMGYLPMPWDDFSMAVSSSYSKPDYEQQKRFNEAWSALPENIKKWRKEMADHCLFGDDDDD